MMKINLQLTLFFIYLLVKTVKNIQNQELLATKFHLNPFKMRSLRFFLTSHCILRIASYSDGT